MSADAGLNLQVGLPGRAPPGMLSVGWEGDTDVPFAPGEDFPFEDGAVDAMRVGTFAATLPTSHNVHLLLECRRVLRPNGRLSMPPPADADGARSLAEHAALVGLVAARDTGADLGWTKPERRASGTPLVSIAIPAYNPRYFAAALDSALAQTYANLEIVVCDDSEGRAIEDIVASRAARRPVRYARNAERLRPRANFTRCFERSEGEFIKFLCDDDLLAPTCVERLLEGFRRAPDITLATSHRARIDHAGTTLAPLPATWPIVADDAVIAGPTLANAMVMAGLNTIGEPSTALFRRAELADQAPDYFRFRGTAGHGIIDMVMWAALLMKGNAVYLRDAQSSFRFHPEQRQHDPAMRARSVESIRALQAAWLALGIHERHPPDELLARPFPPAAQDWAPRALQGLTVRRA